MAYSHGIDYDTQQWVLVVYLARVITTAMCMIDIGVDGSGRSYVTCICTCIGVRSRGRIGIAIGIIGRGIRS